MESTEQGQQQVCYDEEKLQLRVKYGKRSAVVSIFVISVLFIVKIILGYQAGSISILANAFHLLSHLANSAILLLSFNVMSKPPTKKTPFGHGRMEYVAPLIMSIFLFVLGFELLEGAIHQVLDPHELHFFPLLPWILLVTIIVKELLGRYIAGLAHEAESHAIHSTAYHHRIDAIMSITVVAGLFVSEYFHVPVVDGYIGVVVSIWLLHLGYDHAKESITPLLGKAPDRELLEDIRVTAKCVDGIEDVHEIIVQDYGSMYLISLHAEIHEKHGPAKMHAISEKCEAVLRERFKGEAVCHTDPLMEMTPEVKKIIEQFSEVIADYDKVISFHDFRVVRESDDSIIVAADVDVPENIMVAEYEFIAEELERRTLKKIDGVAYCTFYITPKFSY